MASSISDDSRPWFLRREVLMREMRMADALRAAGHDYEPHFVKFLEMPLSELKEKQNGLAYRQGRQDQVPEARERKILG